MCIRWSFWSLVSHVQVKTRNYLTIILWGMRRNKAQNPMKNALTSPLGFTHQEILSSLLGSQGSCSQSHPSRRLLRSSGASPWNSHSGVSGGCGKSSFFSLCCFWSTEEWSKWSTFYRIVKSCRTNVLRSWSQLHWPNWEAEYCGASDLPTQADSEAVWHAMPQCSG